MAIDKVKNVIWFFLPWETGEELESKELCQDAPNFVLMSSVLYDRVETTENINTLEEREETPILSRKLVGCI